MVITARNPVHSVLWLILAFFNAAGLFLLMGAEFLAMILVVVYVGAVAVLFLFVVMMLDVDFEEFRRGFMQNLPIGALIAADLRHRAGARRRRLDLHAGGAEHEAGRHGAAGRRLQHAGARPRALHEIRLSLPGSGLVLLVAMIGAIVLTMRPSRPHVRVRTS